jgi:hypothetical protein
MDIIAAAAVVINVVDAAAYNSCYFSFVLMQGDKYLHIYMVLRMKKKGNRLKEKQLYKPLL